MKKMERLDLNFYFKKFCILLFIWLTDFYVNAHTVYYSTFLLYCPVLSRFVPNTCHFWNNGGSAWSFGGVVNHNQQTLCLQSVCWLCRLLGSCGEGVRVVLNRLGLWSLGCKSVPSLFSKCLGEKKAIILSFPLIFYLAQRIVLILLKTCYKNSTFIHSHFEEYWFNFSLQACVKHHFVQGG